MFMQQLGKTEHYRIVRCDILSSAHRLYIPHGLGGMLWAHQSLKGVPEDVSRNPMEVERHPPSARSPAFAIPALAVDITISAIRCHVSDASGGAFPRTIRENLRTSIRPRRRSPFKPQ